MPAIRADGETATRTRNGPMADGSELDQIHPEPDAATLPDPSLRAARLGSWLLTKGAEAPDLPTLLTVFAERLRRSGMMLDRMSLHIRLLHPQIRGLTYIWRMGGGAVEVIQREHGVELTPAFKNSPIAAITEGGADGIHIPIGRVPPPYPFEILDELKVEGFTDYAAMAMKISGGRRGVATFATRSAEGFTTADLSLIHDILPALSALVEVRALRLLTTNLLDVYVGSEAGQRILNGDIRRGSGVSISAVLWYCDLRGFTQLADRLPMDQLIALLNNYFDIMGGAVARRGGEILKFIGDAMLAIFPVEAAESDEEVCRKCVLAIDAATEAIAVMKRLNAQRAAWGQPMMGAGIALHVGEVMYGNIGAADRLDFTVIGPAVNFVTRLEGVTRQLDRSLLTSAAFADVLSRGPLAGRLTSLGHYPIKGLIQPVEVFGLVEAIAPAAAG